MCHTILTPGCQEGVSGRPEGVRRSLLLSEHVDFVLCKLAKSSEPVRFGSQHKLAKLPGGWILPLAVFLCLDCLSVCYVFTRPWHG